MRRRGEVKVSLLCKTPSRTIKIGWISFQPDGAISFGLTDKTYVSPKFKISSGLFNLYNQISIAYVQPSDPTALECVKNPHFTFHPAMLFHLTDRTGRSQTEITELFRAVNDVQLTVEQYGEMPWIRSVSTKLENLSESQSRSDNILDIPWIANAPSEDLSAMIELDFVRPTDVPGTPLIGEWFQIWKTTTIRCRIKFTYPQVPTLGWFHVH